MKLILLLNLLIIINLSNIYGQDNTATNDISGTIISAENDKELGISKGDPVIGATIRIKGTGVGTATDVDGNFKLTNVPVGSILEISYSGFKNQQLAVEVGKSEYPISLSVDSKELDEVVAVGYQEMKRSQVTGSNVSVSEKDMKATINSGLDQALQGRAAGVTVTQSSGSPGAAASVVIRGQGSLNGAQPLYVIDGVPLGYENLNMLNPSDIETMEVLKDASAAAIYGARGANGVVLITTKRGKNGKGKVEFDAMYGVQNVWKKLDVLDKDQYLNYVNDINSSKPLRPYTPAFSQDSIARFWGNGGKGTNWQDEILRQGKIENYNLSARGGNANASYAISVGYFKNSGVLLNSDFDRFSTRINTDMKPKKWLKIGQNVSFSRSQSNYGSEFGGSMQAALTGSPLIPVYANLPGDPILWGANRNSFIYGANDMINPVALNTVKTNNQVQTRFLGNVFAEIGIGTFLGIAALEGLKFRTNIGADFFTQKTLSVNNAINYPSYSAFTAIKTVNDDRDHNFMWLIDNTLSYSKSIKKHEFTALAGISSQYFYRSRVTAGGSNFPLSINTVGQASDEIRSVGGADYDNSLLGYIGRVNYAYNNKYLITTNIRYDGSSRFGPNNKFGVFPSVSVGWRISNEAFMKNALWISDLKVRVGYGLTGNQEIGNYRYSQVIIPNIIRYPLGSPDQVILPGTAPTLSLANPNLKWESSEQLNFGLDFAILRNSLSLTVDYFEKNSKGMLVKVPLAGTSGITGSGSGDDVGQPGFLTNIGSVSNRGIEIMVSYRNENGPFKFSVSPNGTFLWNNVDALAPGLPQIFDNNGITVTRVGQPIGSFFGYQTDGILQSTADGVNYVGNSTAVGQAFGKALPGDQKFVDINNDGVINAADRVFLGNPIPKFSYGITAEARFVGFDLRIFVQGVQGVSIYNQQRISIAGMQNGGPPDGNQSTEILGRWTPTNPSNTTPRAVTSDPAQNTRVSNRWIEDGSYLRIKSVQIGYSLPEALLKKIFRTEDGVSFRFYLQAQNLFTFTSYRGFDPEVGPTLTATDGRIATSGVGVDNGTYPQPRTFSGGVQISF